MRIAVLLVLSLFISGLSYGQSGKGRGVYVDKKGVLRWEKDGKEAVFFGVNYTSPFAYGYRSHGVLKADLERAIDQDVYHLSRLGIDAFRVHIWDTEISDSLGNVLNNEHLRLFDYLVAKLKERNIRIFITPIAFWGNGYPEKDERTPGFSRVYGKQQVVVNELGIRAQENYVRQLVQHVNPYTKLSYLNDPDIIAAEVNNEPHHTGPKEKVTEYINRLAAAMRAGGWKKPVFYNISESPAYADAVAKANIDGISMQWYPTGLVANHTLQGNYLPNVDEYHIPFDTIPAFANKARMVYEFDAGDVLQPIMYPAMARSFRKAGFQWATQFAYDPLATAYANTEYQTHYLNLAYTPAKAISLLIASRAFHTIPRFKDYGRYPADSTFGDVRVSYAASLSELNSASEFFYTGTTSTAPRQTASLKHIAGTGSSPVVSYTGYGAYFLDKLADGVWRLEVMPDALPVRDPFAKASLSKEVRRVEWNDQTLTVSLPDLGQAFTIQALNNGNTYTSAARAGAITIQPGSYLLVKAGGDARAWKGDTKLGALQLNEFAAPKPVETALYVNHTPLAEVIAGKSFAITAIVPGIKNSDVVTLELNSTAGVWKSIVMDRKDHYQLTATIPAEVVVPGLLEYRMIVRRENGDFASFPGNHTENPWAWDAYRRETWQTFVAAANGALTIFDATTDRDVYVYPNLWRPEEKQFTAGDRSGQLVLKLNAKELKKGDAIGIQYFFGDRLNGRKQEVKTFKNIVVRMRTINAAGLRVKTGLINREGICYAAYVEAGESFQDIRIPLSGLKRDAALLLPRPYPGFQPLWFEGTKGTETFALDAVEKVEVLITAGAATQSGVGLVIERIWLE